MIAEVIPSKISGSLQAPASKSSMQRACALALVHKGRSVIQNPGHANDDLAALSIIRDLGAKPESSGADLIVESAGFPKVKTNSNGEVYPKNSVHCGESGLGIRMFTPVIALSDQEITINGSGSLVNRPMDFFDKILPQLGVSIQTNKGKLPITLRGPLQPANIEIDGSLSSQFLTGLLIAFSAAGASGVSIRVNQLQSKPYIDLTLDVMKQFGMQVPENRSYQEFYFPGPLTTAKEKIEYIVEGDWSGGAFLLVAGAVSGKIRVNGLDKNSTQADKAILAALEQCGALLNFGENWIECGPGKLKTFSFDATDCPDLFPPLAALASYIEGITEIRGTDRLTHKESNRALTLRDEFEKLGIKMELLPNTMRIHGTGHPKTAVVHSRHDHRIAMACAVAALGAEGPVKILEAQAVNKSYPDFYKDLALLNAEVNLAEIEEEVSKSNSPIH